MPEVIHFQIDVPPSAKGQRLDQVASALFAQFSRARLQKWIKAGCLTVNGQALKPKDKLAGEERLELNAAMEPETNSQAQNIALNIIFEDDDVLVVNKPANLVVHPAPGNLSGTLVNALLHYRRVQETLPRAGIIHRLDKDTTGLMVVAKSLPAHTKLVQCLQERNIKRCYQALVQGVMTGGGCVDRPVGRHPKHRTKMAVTGNGKPARTHYRIKKKFKQFTWLDLQLETGRTHQIRVHMAYLGYPIIGDSVYGQPGWKPKGGREALLQALRNFQRQALHAASLEFEHPLSGEPLAFQAPLPEDMVSLLECIENHNHD